MCSLTTDLPPKTKCIVHGLAQRERPVVDHLTQRRTERKREDPVTLPHVYGGVTMHVRTCMPHFYISGTAESIALRFGM